MRCPDCNVFVPLANEEPEVNDPDFGEGSLIVSVRIVLTCENCGTELKEAEVEADFSDALPEGFGDDWEVEVEADPTDWYETKDRHGKPIKSMRYQKHYWGAELTATLTPPGDGDGAVELTETVGKPGSYFEELV